MSWKSFCISPFKWANQICELAVEWIVNLRLPLVQGAILGPSHGCVASCSVALCLTKLWESLVLFFAPLLIEMLSSSDKMATFAESTLSTTVHKLEEASLYLLQLNPGYSYRLFLLKGNWLVWPYTSQMKMFLIGGFYDGSLTIQTWVLSSSVALQDYSLLEDSGGYIRCIFIYSLHVTCELLGLYCVSINFM